MIHHLLGNFGVVDKYGRLGRGFRATTVVDADLWAVMRQCQKEWWKLTEVYWAKAHAEEAGKQTDCHEKENKRADEDTEAAYKHQDTPVYREVGLRIKARLII